MDGQIHGGLAQGAGRALLEGLPCDEAGQPLAASLQDYCLPRAGDLPACQVVMCPTLSPGNAFGAKGCAEVGSIGPPPAIINAVLDALSPLRTTSMDMPATREKGLAGHSLGLPISVKEPPGQELEAGLAIGEAVGTCSSSATR